MFYCADEVIFPFKIPQGEGKGGKYSAREKEKEENLLETGKCPFLPLYQDLHCKENFSLVKDLNLLGATRVADMKWQ